MSFLKVSFFLNESSVFLSFLFNSTTYNNISWFQVFPQEIPSFYLAREYKHSVVIYIVFFVDDESINTKIEKNSTNRGHPHISLVGMFIW